MIEQDKNTYIEYASIVFCSLCFLYFVNSIYHSNFNFHKQNELKNFEIYKTILSKYNAEIIDLQVVEGQVEAFVKKESFQIEDFIAQEPYLIETFDSHYLITFKNVKKVDKKKIKELEVKTKELPITEELVLENFCYLDQNNWSLSINGLHYTAKNKNINNIAITKVTEDEVHLLSCKKRIVFQV